MRLVTRKDRDRIKRMRTFLEDALRPTGFDEVLFEHPLGFVLADAEDGFTVPFLTSSGRQRVVDVQEAHTELARYGAVLPVFYADCDTAFASLRGDQIFRLGGPLKKYDVGQRARMRELRDRERAVLDVPGDAYYFFDGRGHTQLRRYTLQPVQPNYSHLTPWQAANWTKESYERRVLPRNVMVAQVGDQLDVSQEGLVKHVKERVA